MDRFGRDGGDLLSLFCPLLFRETLSDPPLSLLEEFVGGGGQSQVGSNP